MMNRKKERNWRYFSIGSKSELECDMVNIIYLSLLHLLTMMTASVSRKTSPSSSVAAYIWCASIPSLALWLGWIAIALILDRELYLIIKGENKLFSSSICLEFESRDTLITYFLPKSWPSVTWVVYFFWNFKNLLHIPHIWTHPGHYMTLTLLLSGSGLQLLVLVYTLLLLVFRLGRSSASCPAYKSPPVLVWANSEYLLL